MVTVRTVEWTVWDDAEYRCVYAGESESRAREVYNSISEGRLCHDGWGDLTVVEEHEEDAGPSTVDG